MIIRENIKPFLILCKKVRRYFDPSIQAVIHDLLKKGLDAQNGDEMIKSIGMATLFMPPIGTHIAAMMELLKPGSRLYVMNSRRFEVLLLTLLSRFAKYTQIFDQSDFGLFLDLLLGHLKLASPASNNERQDKKLYRFKHSLDMISSIAPSASESFGKILAYSIFYQPALFDHVRLLLRGLDSYCHPSNTSSWTDEIANFLASLVQHMAKIHHKEKYSINEESMSDWTSSIWNVLNRLLFAKNPFIVLTAANTTRHLVYLFPKTIIQEILTTSISTFSSNSEVKVDKSFIHHFHPSPSEHCRAW